MKKTLMINLFSKRPAHASSVATRLYNDLEMEDIQSGILFKPKSYNDEAFNYMDEILYSIEQINNIYKNISVLINENPILSLLLKIPDEPKLQSEHLTPYILELDNQAGGINIFADTPFDNSWQELGEATDARPRKNIDDDKVYKR